MTEDDRDSRQDAAKDAAPEQKATGGGFFGSFAQTLIALDIYGKKPELYLPSGQASYKTLTGCIATLLTIILVGSFATIMSVYSIIDEQNYSIHASIETDFYGPDDMFPAEVMKKEVQFAFGVTASGYPDQEIPAAIGTIKAYYRKWDFRNGGEIEYEELPSHPCSYEELGLLAPEGAADGRRLDGHMGHGFFMPREKSTRNFLMEYQGRLRCLDEPDKMTLMGDRYSYMGQSLVFLLEACKEENCSANVREVLQGKSMIFYANQKPFDDMTIDEPYKMEAKFFWVPIGPELIENHYFKMKQTSITIEKNLLRPFLEDTTLASAFELNKSSSVGFKDMKEGVLAAVTIERSLDLEKLTWTLDNSIANILGLTGGFALMVWAIFYVLDYYTTDTKFKNYVASELYTVEEENKSTLSMKRGLLGYGFFNEIIPADGRPLNLGKVSFFYRLFWCCCRLNKAGKTFTKARELSTQELNISSIVKSQRESKAAVHLLKESMGESAEAAIQATVKRIVYTSASAEEAAKETLKDLASVRQPLKGDGMKNETEADQDGNVTENSFDENEDADISPGKRRGRRGKDEGRGGDKSERKERSRRRGGDGRREKSGRRGGEGDEKTERRGGRSRNRDGGEDEDRDERREHRGRRRNKDGELAQGSSEKKRKSGRRHGGDEDQGDADKDELALCVKQCKEGRRSRSRSRSRSKRKEREERD